MEVIAVGPYWAGTAEPCCQILSSLKTMSFTYGLRAMGQLPVLGMTLSGPHHPLVRHLHFIRETDIGEKNLGGGGVS